MNYEAITLIAVILYMFAYIIWQEIQIKKLKEKCERQIRAEREWACMVERMHGKVFYDLSGKKKEWYQM